MEERHRQGSVLIVCGTVFILAAWGALLFGAYLEQQARLGSRQFDGDEYIIWPTILTALPGVVMIILGTWRSR